MVIFVAHIQKDILEVDFSGINFNMYKKMTKNTKKIYGDFCFVFKEIC